MPTLLMAFMTWTTYGRMPLIQMAHAAALSGMLPKLAEKGAARLIEAAVVSTHVHVLVRFEPRCDLPRLIQYLKGGSSYLLNRLIANHRPIRWAEGYDLRSTDARSLPALRRYLDGQGHHHGVPLLVRWSVVGPSGPASAEAALEGGGGEGRRAS